VRSKRNDREEREETYDIKKLSPNIPLEIQLYQPINTNAKNAAVEVHEAQAEEAGGPDLVALTKERP
jgi:hypothetical protein